MPPENQQSPSLEALRKVIEAADSSRVTRDDFTALAKQIIEIVKADKQINAEKRAELLSQVQSALSSLESRLEAELARIEATVQSLSESGMSKLMFDHEAMMAELRAKADSILDGEDADEEVIVEKVLARLPPKEELAQETAISIADKLDTLDERDQLEAIKKLQKQIDELKRRPTSVGGVVRLNTLSDLILTANGTVDDSNVTFSFSYGKPKMVNVNGAFYLEGHGWTFTSGNVVLDAPVGAGGHVFGIK